MAVSKSKRLHEGCWSDSQHPEQASKENVLRGQAMLFWLLMCKIS
jgi:hypothetical protein